MDGTSQTNVNEGVMVGDLFDDTPASYALGLLGGTTYDQPVPLASLPPSSAGVAFVPLPASQAGAVAAACSYPATAVPPPLSNPHEIAFRQLQQQHHRRQQEVEQELRAFWAGQLAEAAAAEMSSRPPVHHSLPLARIKKIMKADKDVKMIAAEAPVVFAKACEMFILELTLRAWLHAGGTRRRTLHGSDVAAVITSNEAYDFLIDIMPEEEHRSGDVVPPPPLPSTMTTEHRSGDVVPPPPLPSTMTPSYGLAPAASSVPFAVYANNMQPVTYMWATPEHHQQNSDGGRDRQDY